MNSSDVLSHQHYSTRDGVKVTTRHGTLRQRIPRSRDRHRNREGAFRESSSRTLETFSFFKRQHRPLLWRMNGAVFALLVSSHRRSRVGVATERRPPVRP